MVDQMADKTAQLSVVQTAECWADYWVFQKVVLLDCQLVGWKADPRAVVWVAPTAAHLDSQWVARMVCPWAGM